MDKVLRTSEYGTLARLYSILVKFLLPPFIGDWGAETGFLDVALEVSQMEQIQKLFVHSRRQITSVGKEEQDSVHSPTTTKLLQFLFGLLFSW